MATEENGVPSLTDYHFSEKFGFLLEDPLDSLPDYFGPWHNIAKRLPQLLKTNKVRDEVNKMPKLDEKRLEGYRQWRLANLQLCAIGSAYIWQGGATDTIQSLPSQLAVPWTNTARYLGLPSGITYASLFLSNYRLINPTKPFSLDNVKVIYCVGIDEETVPLFYLLTLWVEFLGKPCIQAITSCMDGVSKGDELQVKTCLEAMTKSLVAMTNGFDKIDELLHPDKFYHEVRPYLGGWGGEGSPMPNGLKYEGSTSGSVSIIGVSAAQSAVIQCLDASLKIKHDADKEAFLEKMRTYMPPAHAELIQAFRRGPCVRHFVENHRSANPELLKAFNDSVDAVSGFRTRHIKIVTRFVLLPAGRAKKGSDQSEEKGTGGQLVVPFLRGIRDTTKNGRLDQP